METTPRKKTSTPITDPSNRIRKSSNNSTTQKNPISPQLEKFVIHNPAVGIEYPPKPNEQFAVIQVDGFQYKIMEDSILLLDTK